MNDKDVKIKIVQDKLTEFGCEKQLINRHKNYVFQNWHYKVSYIPGLKSIVIESARNAEEALLNIYEDSSLLPVDIDNYEFIELVIEDLRTGYFT